MNREKAMKRFGAALATGAIVMAGAAAQAQERAEIIERSLALTPAGPWGEGDQAGMGNTQGPGTWLRCAEHLAAPGAVPTS